MAAVVTGADSIELAAGPGRAPDPAELQIYLRVWHVLEPSAEVEVES